MLNLTVGEALERQHELAQWLHTARGRAFADGWITARQRDKYVTAYNAQAEAHLLLRCPLYLVSADMEVVAMHAAESIPEEELLDSDLPSPEGFVVLERGLHIPDIHHKRTSFAAFTWYRRQASIERAGGVTNEGPVIVLTFYSDRDSTEDEYMIESRREYGGAVNLTWGFPKYIAIGQNFIPLNAPLMERANNNAMPAEAIVFVDKFPRALFALMRQRIHETTEQRAERHVRRRLEREGSPLAQRLVRVVNLRKVVHEVQPGGGGAPVQWQQRWIVSGHWRNVWHASIQQHRLQWIAPFVKGPEDKPLVIKKTVGKLVR